MLDLGFKLGVLLLLVLAQKTTAKDLIWEQENFAQPPELVCDAESLSVLWWNVQNGESSRIHEEDPLTHNVEALLMSELKPDIILFGEYSQELFPKRLQQVLFELYPHSSKSLLKYSDNLQTLGYGVFSNIPLEITATKTLNFYPSHLKDTEEIKQYLAQYTAADFRSDTFWYRNIYTLTHKQSGLNIIPVHLLNPWRQLFTVFGNGAMGGMRTLLQMAYGKDHPLVYQITEFKAYLSANYSNSKYVTLGDFNTPREVPLLANRNLFQSLQGELFDQLHTHPVKTWPGVSSNLAKYNQLSMSIDHSFVSHLELDAKQGIVLPLKGSDHYPLRVCIKKT